MIEASENDMERRTPMTATKSTLRSALSPRSMRPDLIHPVAPMFAASTWIRVGRERDWGESCHGAPAEVLSLLLLLLVAGAAATDQIFTTSGVWFGKNSRELRYRVEFHTVDSPCRMDNGQESEPMTSHEGKHYTCYLPVEETMIMKSIVPQNATNVIIESEQKVKPKEPDELLEILKDQCFYREDWWSYEFCYYGKNQQVHVEGYSRVCSRWI